MASLVEELNFPHILEIPITIDQVVPVFPSGPIPASHEDSLFLSNLDDMVGARVFTPTVYFYPHIHDQSNSIINVLKEALERVLVPYYPFTGRLREIKNNGKLEVYFGPNQGALLVEARSSLALDKLGDATVPNPAWKKLIFHFPDENQYKVIDMPLLIAQVTHFSCGGFCLGLRICHCICDGVGAMQFLSTWASTAKLGSLVLSPKPCWEREMFKARNPPRIVFPHNEFKSIDDGSTLTKCLWEAKPIQKCYRLSRQYQAHLKCLVQQHQQEQCTTFDAIAAHVWRSLVKALDVKPHDYELRLTFSVNTRPKLENPPLKQGFYGNAFSIACATSKVCDLLHGRLGDTTQLIREARVSVSQEYLKSMIDYIELCRPKRLEFGGKLTITQWTRFPIYDSADFGWGRPMYAGPIDLTPTPQVCVFLPGGDDGSMLLCLCLPHYACNKFRQLLTESNNM